eukprot:15431254-Alexandrium_andersonii.AAC.1
MSERNHRPTSKPRIDQAPSQLMADVSHARECQPTMVGVATLRNIPMAQRHVEVGPRTVRRGGKRTVCQAGRPGLR